jgi:hypothetical protein
MILIKKLVLALAILLALPAAAQKSAAPEKFSISDKEILTILSTKAENKLSMPANPYINNALAVRNVRTGDIHYVRLKLVYFKDAYLTVQENGKYTTQVFVMSESGAVFYKGELKEGVVSMEKCSKDDIVVE